MTTTIELWAVIDAQENYAAGTTQADAIEKYEETVGPLNESNGYRVIQLNVTVPVPSPLELTGTVKDDEPAMMTAK